MRVVRFDVGLILMPTAAWGQDQPAATGAFRVTWQPQTHPVASRMEGRVHNESRFPVTNVRLQIEGFDGDSRPVGRTSAWAIGDIAPGGETSFVFEAMPGGIIYQIKVYSFDVVSRHS